MALARGRDGAACLAGHDDGVDVEVAASGRSPFPSRSRPDATRRTRRRPDDGGLVLLQHEEQAVGGHGAHPDGKRAQTLRADDVGAADVQREVERMDVAVVRAHAGLPEQARLGVLPQVEVLLREGAHRGNAGGAGRGGHEDDLLLGNGAHLAEERCPRAASRARSSCRIKGNFAMSVKRFACRPASTPASSNAALVVDRVLVSVRPPWSCRRCELQLPQARDAACTRFRDRSTSGRTGMFFFAMMRCSLLSRSAGGRLACRGFAVRIETPNCPVFNAGY